MRIQERIYIYFGYHSDDKAAWSVLLYRLFPEKRESKSGLVAQMMLRASVSTRRARLSTLLVSAVSSPGHQLQVSSE